MHLQIYWYLIHLLQEVSEQNSEEVHFLDKLVYLPTIRTRLFTLIGSFLNTVSVKAYRTAFHRTLQPIIIDRGVAKVAKGAGLGWQNGKGAVLSAVWYRLLILVQCAVWSSTVKVVVSSTVLKCNFEIRWE